MANILITGCSGFLAPYLVQVFEKEGGHTIMGMTEQDRFRSDRMQVFHIDIRDKDKVMEMISEAKPDIVIHLAAISNVWQSWRNQKLTYEVNFIGSSNLLEAVAHHSKDARVLLMSSAEVYGARRETLTEETPTSVKNPYSLSKYAMEMLGDLYVMSRHLQVVKVRSFNFTGPGQEMHFVCSDFAHQIAEIENGNREPVIRVGNLSAHRDFSDVRDIARYLAVISQQGEVGQTYNLCSGKTYSIREILDILCNFSKENIKVEIDQKKFRPVDIPVLSGDCTRIKEQFDLTPKFTLKQTLMDVLNFWRNQ